MLKKFFKLFLMTFTATVLVACGGGSSTVKAVDAQAQSLQNPSAYRLSETVSAVPPQ
jgi:hypothetical protein